MGIKQKITEFRTLNQRIMDGDIATDSEEIFAIDALIAANLQGIMKSVPQNRDEAIELADFLITVVHPEKMQTDLFKQARQKLLSLVADNHSL